MNRKLSIILSSEAPHKSDLWIKPIDEFRWELTYFNGVEWRPLDITYFNSADREKLDYIFDFIDELDAAHFGLGNVDNTSDLNKPVSAATQEALDNKINLPTTGVKVTGIDAGTFGTISITDDYIYFCGVTGDSNNAVWFPIENSIKTQQTLTNLETVLKTYTDNKFAEKVGVYNVSYCVPIYPEYYSSMEAREAVAVSIRKPGLVLTYEDYEKHWVVERFIGASLSNWLVNEEWEEIAVTKEYTDNLLSNKEDKLPAIPSNPELKFLNGLKEWTSIVIGAGGYTAPLYFTNIDSDIQGYKKISNIPDSSVTELSTTLTSSEGKKFFRAYICDDSINTTTIDAGPWVSSFLVKVSNATGYTNLVLDVYRRTSIGKEIFLFTANSTEINQTNFTETTRNQSDQGVFVTELTDRIVFKIYGETTTGSTITITTSIGGAEASYVTTPIALRHRQLREPNENENYLHITKEAQMFDGVKTFSSSPIVPNPTTDMQTAPKKYVDDLGETLSGLMEDTADSIDYISENVEFLSTKVSELEVTVVGKVNGAFSENGLLYLTADGNVIGQGIEVGSGGSGGSGGGTGLSANVVIRISSGYSSVFAIPENSPAVLHFLFTSVYTEDLQETGPGQATLSVNGSQKLVTDIQQGENELDIKQYLSLGGNRVTLAILDSLGNGRIIQYTITVVSIGITSTFDYHSVITSSLDFRYTLTGGGEKTVHFVIDGEEIASVVSSWVNRQISQVIPMQTHGSHVLEVYATALVNGLTVSSNILRYDTIWFVSGNTDPIIISQYINTTALLYETVQIPYIVYGSTSSSIINLKVDGDTVNTLTVDRTEHIWSYRIMSGTIGSVKVFTIQCGDVTKTFNLTLSGSSIPIEAETSNLQLYLSSYGRSNSQSNKSEWNFESIESVLTDFNWSTDGWQIDDEGVTCLRILGDARVTIPLNIFATDARVNGKTIEIEFSTHDISNEDAVVLTNISGNVGVQITSKEATLRSQQSFITTKFKDSEHIRLSFVIGRSSEYRLAYLYINAILSQVIKYSTTDSFIQGTPVGLTIGSNDATIDLYSIRVYDSDLNQFQLVDNFIVDVTNVNQMLALYDKNAIFNEYGDLSYDLTCDRIPCMTLIGPLPTYKGDKKSVSITYENRQDSTKNFSAVCKVGKTNIDVQGTSSQYYPRKNYKISLDKSIVTQGGITLEGGNYKLRDDSIAVPIYTVKADFAEASGAHNTGMARMVDELLKDLGILTPPQLVNEDVRTTVDGFPIVIFHKATAESDPVFLGKYNFNTDKGSTDAYGFTDLLTHESWEFLNNTSPICLFRSDDFTSLDGEGNPAWLLDLEARYPDGFEDPTNLQLLWSWILSCDGDSAKFKTECSQHFNVDFLISYYLITEIFGMVDQRAKNMFATTWGNEGGANRIWYFIFYDNDTCLGINNEGVNVFDYNIEYHDPSVWNGESSLLWELVEEAFADEISAMYALMRQSEALTYDKVQNQLTTEQTDKWSESIYNLDGKYKYIDPGIEGGNWTYLYAAQGSRKEHRKYWLSNRLRYLDSKYFIGDYSDDFILMRLYTPEGVLPVPVNHDFSVDLYSSGYLRIKFGSYIVVGRGSQGETLVVPAPSGMTFNDTETIIYGASSISNLGSLAAKYAGSLDFSKATKLEEIIIGSTVPGYDNPYLGASGGVLNIGNNTLLKIIDIRNCSALTAPLDVSGCSGIKEIYATGSGISTVVLPSGGNLEKMYLPATITNLTIRNQAKLTLANLTLTSKANILALWLENTPLLDIWAFYLLCVNVAYIRLIGVNITAANGTAVYESLTKGGISELGNYIPNPVVTGDFFATEIAENHYNAIVAAYPELNVTYGLLDIVIQFADATVKAILLSKGIGTGGEITSKQASLYTNSSFGYSSSTYWFKDNTTITSFDEFRYFTKLTGAYPTCFSGCTNLISFNFPTVLNFVIPDSMFKNTGIETLHIPRNVKLHIGSLAYMTQLKNLTFDPECVVNLSQMRNFEYCSSLEEIVIPNVGVYPTELGGDSFSHCSMLHTVTVPNVILSIGYNAFEYCTNLRIIIGIENVTSIGGYAFQYSGIESFDFSNVQTLRDSCFYYSGLKHADLSFVLSIGKYCFSNCRSLESVILSDSMIEVPEGLFSQCSSLQRIPDFPDSVLTLKRSCFFQCNTAIKNSDINLNKITTVEENSLLPWNFKSLYGPNVTSFVGNFDYNGMYNTTTVSLDLPKLTTLNSSIYYPLLQVLNLPELQSVSIPSGTYASFIHNCNTITSISLPKLQSLKCGSDTAGVVSSCANLESIDLPLLETLTINTTHQTLFINNPKLTYINIPLIKVFGYRCFLRCSAFEILDFTDLVSIGNECFYGCSSLITFICRADTPPTLGTNVFYGTHANLVIYVPAASVDAYKAATNWSTYASKIQAIS